MNFIYHSSKVCCTRCHHFLYTAPLMCSVFSLFGYDLSWVTLTGYRGRLLVLCGANRVLYQCNLSYTLCNPVLCLATGTGCPAAWLQGGAVSLQRAFTYRQDEGEGFYHSCFQKQIHHHWSGQSAQEIGKWSNKTTEDHECTGMHNKKQFYSSTPQLSHTHTLQIFPPTFMSCVGHQDCVPD